MRDAPSGRSMPPAGGPGGRGGSSPPPQPETIAAAASAAARALRVGVRMLVRVAERGVVVVGGDGGRRVRVVVVLGLLVAGVGLHPPQATGRRGSARVSSASGRAACATGAAA